ncbi:MAG: hypothetical protein IJF01_07360 [Tidjanibacter sp.]|nr:hypothetical protein [Tidjanibacter sp.]
MKIEELSIGDWVRYDFPKIGKRNIQVNSIDEEDNHIGAGGVGASAWSDISEFEPIPLTPEILEKNGWVHCGPCHWRNRDIKCSCFRFGRRYWDIHTRGSRVYRPTRISIENILHTHQLQHALRLAGIDKEIEV